eukprot:749908-Hanusia_phi.AAC.7
MDAKPKDITKELLSSQIQSNSCYPHKFNQRVVIFTNSEFNQRVIILTNSMWLHGPCLPLRVLAIPPSSQRSGESPCLGVRRRRGPSLRGGEEESREAEGS